MKVFVAFSALLAVASASHLYFAPRFIAPTAFSQYYPQDGIGKLAFGNNWNNVLQTVDYTKAPVVFAQELPKQIEDTAEVAAAKAAHFAAVEEAKKRNWDQGSVVWAQAPIELPRQVEDTLEVSAAKAAHFAAVEEAKKRNWDQGSVVWAQAPVELPRQVVDTLEVSAAKAAHFAAIEEAKKRNGDQGTVVWGQATIELPKPVVDTPEVARAKAEHLIAIEQAKSRNSLQQKIDGGFPLVYGAPLIAPIQLTAYGALPKSRGFTYTSSVGNAPFTNW